MALRIRFNYQWRLFIPLVVTLWAIIIGMAIWNVKRDNAFRREYISSQLQLINERIVEADKTDIDVVPFLNFAEKFYRKSQLFDGIRVTIYDPATWDIKNTIGQPINLSAEQRKSVMEDLSGVGSKDFPNSPTGRFFYRAQLTPNGKRLVITALPFDEELQLYLDGGARDVWYVVFIIAALATILSYFSTRYLSRNINLLREFAKRSATDPTFEPDIEFPHDELGDIARQIVTLFNERSKARVRMEKEHRVALLTIEEKARQKRALTNNINHELKTPIGVIRGYLEILDTNPDLDEQQRKHFIHKTLEHTDRLVSLLSDVAAITRLDEASNKIATESFDFHDMAYSFASDVEESGAMGKMDFIFDIPIGTYVKANYNLMSGVLLNFTKNAVNYSQGTHCTLKLIGKDDEFYHFSFSDNGVGVGEEHLPYLFDRFYRVDSGRARKSGGTGLGLAIVYNTILANGGTITAGRGDEGGLEFKFTIPRDKKTDDKDKPTDDAPAQSPDGNPGNTDNQQ